MGNPRDINLDIVGHDKTERATRSAERNLDRLKRKTQEFDKSSKSVSAVTSQFVALATTLKAGGVYAAIGLIGAAIAALPAIGSLAAGGLVLALGGGLAALGLMFAAKNEAIRREFAKTFATISKTLREISKPFEPVLMHLAALIRQTFAVFTPHLAQAFQKMAPAVDRMFTAMAAAVQQLAPTIGPVTDAFIALMDAIGPQLPVWTKGIADGIIAIAESIRANPATFASLVGVIAKLTAGTLQLIAVLSRMANWFQKHPNITRALIAAMSGAVGMLMVLRGAVNVTVGVLNRISGWFRSNAGVTRPFIGALNSTVGAARSFASGMSGALSSAAGAVQRGVAAIKAAINSLPLVRIIRIAVDTGAIGAAVSRAKGLLSSLPGFSAGDTLVTRAGPTFATAGASFAGGSVGGAINVQTGPTTIVNRVEIPGLEPLIRSVVHDEQSRAATRARYGRR